MTALGVQKAGTTSLARYLTTHPDLLMSQYVEGSDAANRKFSVKEIHFFDEYGGHRNWLQDVRLHCSFCTGSIPRSHFLWHMLSNGLFENTWFQTKHAFYTKQLPLIGIFVLPLHLLIQSVLTIVCRSELNI